MGKDWLVKTGWYRLVGKDWLVKTGYVCMYICIYMYVCTNLFRKELWNGIRFCFVIPSEALGRIIAESLFLRECRRDQLMVSC